MPMPCPRRVNIRIGFNSERHPLSTATHSDDKEASNKDAALEAASESAAGSRISRKGRAKPTLGCIRASITAQTRTNAEAETDSRRQASRRVTWRHRHRRGAVGAFVSPPFVSPNAKTGRSPWLIGAEEDCCAPRGVLPNVPQLARRSCCAPRGTFENVWSELRPGDCHAPCPSGGGERCAAKSVFPLARGCCVPSGKFPNEFELARLSRGAAGEADCCVCCEESGTFPYDWRRT
mmetsp:Transcript_31280/g.76099  ORF Transcript_31280/g.76099 Transcript_31280/m.76099 type:complete len:235 (-) Transcript_31280:162-866(-)